MKKMTLIMIIGAFLCLAALTGQDVSIENFTGTVKYEASPGSWEILTRETVLTGDSMVNIGLNSSLVLLYEGSEITIPAMKRGTVNDLAQALEDRTVGISLGGPITGSTLNTDADQGRTNISTASTRASEAQEDMEWEEEEEE